MGIKNTNSMLGSNSLKKCIKSNSMFIDCKT